MVKIKYNTNFARVIISLRFLEVKKLLMIIDYFFKI